MALQVRRIGHIGLLVRDLDVMSSFYEEILGFKLSDRHRFPEDSPYREGVWMRCDTDHHALSMFDSRAPLPEDSERRPGLHHFAFEMESFDALRAAAETVRTRKLRLQGERTGGPGNQLRLYFWDPEGNLIELYYHLDQIGWDGAVRNYPPIVDIDLEQVDIEAWLAAKETPGE